MKLNDHRYTYASTRFITAAAVAAILVFAQEVAVATDKDAYEDRTQLRIKEIRAKLKITPAQEEQWSKVAQAMLDDAKNMDALTQTRVDHTQNMTAVDDLNSYGEITDAHADRVKKLTPLFVALYANMSDAQKKEADTLFRDGDPKQTHKKSVGN